MALKFIRALMLSLGASVAFTTAASGASDVKVIAVPLAPLELSSCSNDGAIRQSDIVNHAPYPLRSYTVEWKAYDDSNKELGGAGLEYQLDSPLGPGTSASFSETVTLVQLGVTRGPVDRYSCRIIGATFTGSKKWVIGDSWKEPLVPLASTPKGSAEASDPTPKPIHRDSPVLVTAMAVQQAGDAWTSCVSFTNVSARVIRAVQFQLTFYDAFDEALTSFRPDRVGEFAAGAVVFPGYPDGDNTRPPDGCWDAAVVAGSVTRVSVEVMKARFADGEIYDASSDPDRAVYAGHYVGAYEDHPAKIKCAFGFTFDWAYAHTVPACAGYIRKWVGSHPPLIEKMKSDTYAVSPIPTATARPTATPPASAPSAAASPGTLP